MDYARSDVSFYPDKILKQYENPGRIESTATSIFNRPAYQVRGINNGKKKQINRKFEDYSCEQ